MRVCGLKRGTFWPLRDLGMSGACTAAGAADVLVRTMLYPPRGLKFVWLSKRLGWCVFVGKTDSLQATCNKVVTAV